MTIHHLPTEYTKILLGPEKRLVPVVHRCGVTVLDGETRNLFRGYVEVYSPEPYGSSRYLYRIACDIHRIEKEDALSDAKTELAHIASLNAEYAEVKS